MSDRDTTQNSQNTRNRKQPASDPARLDRFADDVFESTVEFAKDLSAIRREDNVDERKDQK